MAHVKADRVQETSTSTGTGALTLAGATTKFRAFSAALADTDTCVCLIEHASAAEWEVSLCTFASGAGTLTRSTIYASTNAGSAVNFSAGTKTISLLPTASKMIVADNTGATTIPGALLPAANDGGALGSATLSFSDGFFASGAVLNFANGNYTITHSSGALVFSAAAGVVTLTTTGTSGIRQGLVLSGVNSAPAVDDGVAISGLITNNSAAQVEAARIAFALGTLTGGAEFGDIRFHVIAGGALTQKAILNSARFAPTTNDGLALGSATISWADLFFASGAVLNFANGNYTITHSSGTIALSGTISATGIGIGVTPASLFQINSNVSRTSWTTNAAFLQVGSGTATDTSGSGTIGSRVGNSFGTPTFASSSSVTLTDAATVYIGANPTAGTNTTITNGWALWVDSGNTRFDGSVVSTSDTGGVGYMTGAGGTVTQATSKSTGVTLNKTCGQITMNNANLAADARVSFTVTNSSVATTDVIIANIDSGGTANAYLVYVTAVGAGSFALTVENATAGDLAEAPVISFAVIKGVTS